MDTFREKAHFPRKKGISKTIKIFLRRFVYEKGHVPNIKRHNLTFFSPKRALSEKKSLSEKRGIFHEKGAFQKLKRHFFHPLKIFVPQKWHFPNLKKA